MQLTLIGTGLIGGSFALAVKQAGLVSQVVGIDRSQDNLELALSLGVIDQMASEIPVNPSVDDLLVLAVANEGIAPLVSQHAEFPGLIMDVGSVKAPIVDRVRSETGVCPARFVPCHPVAGSEHSGPRAATANLFAQQTVVITPIEETSDAAVATITKIWQAIGANVLQDTPNNHDRLLATTSHLPHLLAFIYESLIHEEHQPVTGGGYRDFSRIANSDVDLWNGILQLNKDHLLSELEKFEDRLAEAKRLLKAEDKRLFERWLKKL